LARTFLPELAFGADPVPPLAAIAPAALPLFFGPTAYELGAIVWISTAVIICGAIPLTVGVARGQTVLGIIAALMTIPAVLVGCFLGMLVLSFPVGAALGCGAGLPASLVFSFLIKAVPKGEGPLLHRAEVEAEARKIRRDY
jgi:hypothetical protein